MEKIRVKQVVYPCSVPVWSLVNPCLIPVYNVSINNLDQTSY